MRSRRLRSRVEPDGSRLRWPGAQSKFALFGEVLWTGVLVSVVCLAVITWPAAIAAGISHLRRYVHAEASTAGAFFRDVRRAMPGGLVVGTLSVLGAVAVGADLVVGAAGIPGGALVAWIGVAAGVLGLAGIVLAAGLWRPGLRWRTLLAAVPRAIAWDPLGAVSAVVAVALLGVLTWQLLPLLIPGLGLLAFAGMAIAKRRIQRIERAAVDAEE